MALEAHIVAHTHWDREWYHPAELFRQRLVSLVDALLDDPPMAGESFLLDGQMIVVEDYLAIRPERAERLGGMLRDGRLEAGPWYVLADELIPSGEALVRNLLTGRRLLERFEAESPPVLYCPDSFGHPAALPAIAEGFGFPVIVLWRGYGGGKSPSGDTARWIAPGGESALLFHLPRDGYEFGSHLPLVAAEADDRWRRMREELVPRSTTGVMLVPNGADHHARQRGYREACALLERAGADDGVRRSSLRAFSQRLAERSALQPLPPVRGELRDSYGYAWTLQGTFGTRAHEKRLNAVAERMLLRETEPWTALAAMGRTSQRALVNDAWRTLLRAHPHDTLCGCSIDRVAAAMELRLQSAIAQAEALRDDALMQLIRHDPVVARQARADWQPIVLVRNAAPRPRSGVALLDIEEFVADVPVGPGSAGAPPTPAVVPRTRPRIPSLGAVQVLSRTLRHSRTESPQDYPDNDLVSVTRVAAWVADAPPLGITSHAIGSGARRRRLPLHPVVTAPRTMDNGLLSLEVNAEGAVALTHAESGRVIQSLLELVDEGDAGDLYTPAPRPRAVRVEFRGVRRVHRGPLRGQLALRYRLMAETGGDRRGDADVTVNLILDADAPAVRIELLVENRRENHRLRVRLRTDVRAPDVWADVAFGVLRREPVAASAADSMVEQAPRTAPLHRYVSLFGERGGATVFSDGLAEYETDSSGSVLVTLVRAVGELSRGDLPERPGHAGWPVPTPAAQCIGRYEATLAVMLHGPRLAATIDAIERTADDILLPLAGSTLRSALRLPDDVAGVALIGQGLALSTVKESEDGAAMVVRCVNLRDDDVAGEWRLPFEPGEVWLARLDETLVSKLETAGGIVPFVAPPRGIVTLVVRRPATASRAVAEGDTGLPGEPVA